MTATEQALKPAVERLALESCLCARQDPERVLRGNLSLLVCRSCGGCVTHERLPADRPTRDYGKDER